MSERNPFYDAHYHGWRADCKTNDQVDMFERLHENFGVVSNVMLMSDDEFEALIESLRYLRSLNSMGLIKFMGERRSQLNGVTSVRIKC